MEEEEVDTTTTPTSPFWLQTTNNTTIIQRYRRGLSSFFFNSFVLIICLIVLAIVSMTYIIPSIIIDHSNTHILKPNLFRRSYWDSINFFLVFIALVFGFLTRNINNDDENMISLDVDRVEPELSAGAPINSPERLVTHQWYGLQDQDLKFDNGLRRQRTSSSYPDLRELSPPWNHRDAAVDPWRFSDDTHLNYYQVLESNGNYVRRRSRRYQSPEVQEKLYTPSLALLPVPPSLPPQPPAQAVKKKSKRVHHNFGIEDGEKSSGGSGTGRVLLPELESSESKGGRDERKRVTREKRRARSSEPRRLLSPVIDPLPDPSSPPPISPLAERKRNGGNAPKDFFTSFYHKKKNKLQRGRSVDNLGLLLHHSEPLAVKFKPLSPSPSLPSPSVINKLVQSKKENKKKYLSVTFAPPTPPPPPPPPIANCAPRPTVTRVAPFVTDKPKAPMAFSGFNGIDESSSGGDSPLKNIPPPPPLPPFKMSDWKFAVEGDFVRFQSTLSSRSVSPDGEEAQSPSSDVDVMTTALTPPFFSPSPDVDTKADNFIARFRAGLRLERMSKLGPGPGPDLDPSPS